MRRVLIRGLPLALAILLSLPAAVGCSGGGNAAGSGSGSLFVYTRDRQWTDEWGVGKHATEVVTYDLTARREVDSFQPGKEGQYIQAQIAGKKLILNLGDRVVESELDGSHQQLLRQAPEGGGIIGIAVSHDGSKLALTEERGRPAAGKGWADVSSIVFLDIVSREEILTVPQSSPGFGGFRGEAGLITWRDDGEGVVLQGNSNSDMPGGTATVMLDGSVQNHDVTSVSVAPNGRYVAGVSLGNSQPCEIFLGWDEIALRDLDSDKDVALVSNDDLFLLPLEWSLDGRELLYATYASRSARTGECQATGGSGVMHDESSERLYLLPVDGSSPKPVTDIDAVRQNWYGERNVRFKCNGEWHPDQWCGGGSPADIYIGDAFVGSAHNSQIVGFIDR